MRNTRPASVSAMRRPIRSNSFVSCRASSAAIAWLTAMVGKRFGRGFALEQGGGHKFDPHHAHHPVLPNPGDFPLSSDRRFVPEFALAAPAPFGLCERPLSLAVILGPLSPHPEIPFLAD